MLNKLMEALKTLSMSDKWLVGVALVILINPTVAWIIAGLVLSYFIYKIGKQVVKD